jgi:hypothetical protein
MLTLGFRGENATLSLGREAPVWADRILNPPSLTKKLGVKPGMRIVLAGAFEASFGAEVVDAGAELTRDSGPSDLVFLRADDPEALSQIPAARQQIRSDGGIWIVTPRGRSDLRDVDVMAAAKAAGLVDIKVCRFSDTHTALKFVIPRSAR